MNDIRQTAVCQRRLVLAMCFAFLIGVVAAAPGPWLDDWRAAVAVAVVAIFFSIATMLLALRLMRAMGQGGLAQLAAAVLMFIPWINLVVLMVMNHKATKLLRSRGCQVGLIGVPRAELDRL